MRIFNIMLSRDLGGIQQVYVDYSESLRMHNHEVINITSIGAKINEVEKTNHRLPNLAPWCILSKIILRILIAFYKPDIIICHGARAVNFAKAFWQKQSIVVGISHNYSYKHLRKCDYVITLTNELKEHLIKHGIKVQKLLSLPNMTRIKHSYNPTEYRSPIVIGTMGRFVSNKGFIYLIEAVNILKNYGHQLRLMIGGDGEDMVMLERKVNELGLEKEVTFYGWVNDKDDFFEKIDIFCSSSIVEPFGIILLEAMEHSKPVVATLAGGPASIIRDGQNGLLTITHSAQGLADQLKKMMIDSKMARKLSSTAYSELKEKYDIKRVSEKLSNLLKEIAQK